MNYINVLLPQIIILCKKYNVDRLHVFGSVLTDKFNEESDIDLIVDFDKENIVNYFDNYFDFKYSLENVLRRKVDLLEGKSVRNKYLRQNIEDTKQLIYEQNKKMA